MTAKHLLAAALAAASCAVGAQTLKPGLWQLTHAVQGGGELARAMADMDQQMATMPPEQRKAMREAMARQGVQLGAASPGGGTTMKVCMTREMVERNDIAGPQGDCRTTRQSRSGNTVKVAFACSNPPSKGEAQVTIAGPEAYASKMTVTTTVDGTPQQVSMDASGKWLGADCGAIKPLAPARK